MIGSEFGIKFATDIAQVSGLDVLIDDRTNSSIGKRRKDHSQVGIPTQVIVGRNVLEPIPKFELISIANDETRILTHSQVIHYFRLLSLNSVN